MHYIVYIPLMLAAALGAAAPTLAARLHPRRAVVLLVGGGLVATIAASLSLAFLGWTLLAQNDEVAEQGGWSVPVLRHLDPVNHAVAGAAVVALAVGIVRGARVLIRTTGELRRASAACRATADVAEGDLVVSTDPGHGAFAVPGRPGRIVVSAALLRTLSPVEVRALLAHERAHLAHHDSVVLGCARALAAANPLLSRLPAAVAFAVERWADEDAARVVGSRRTTAKALAAAALATSRPGWVAAALAAVGSTVPPRVRALLAPPPARRPLLTAAVLVLVAAAAYATYDAGHDTAEMLEVAARAYHHYRG